MKRMVVTVGMFDGVHRGHRHILDTLCAIARQRGGEAVVFTFDCHPRQVLRGKDAVQLLNTAEERLSLLRRYADARIVVLPFDGATAQLSACTFFDTVIASYGAVDTLLLGYDNAFGNKQHDDFDILKERLRQQHIALVEGAPVTVADGPVSSTRIRQVLASGAIHAANEMLGYEYTLTGRVEHGRQIGRTLGVPTANIDCMSDGKVMPADGVYVVDAEVDGVWRRAVANLGMQPTVDGNRRTLEVHLVDTSEELYGRMLAIRFLDRIREVRRFPSLDALAQQIQRDIQYCKNYA